MRSRPTIPKSTENGGGDTWRHHCFESAKRTNAPASGEAGVVRKRVPGEFVSHAALRVDKDRFVDGVPYGFLEVFPGFAFPVLIGFVRVRRARGQVQERVG